MKRTLDAAYFFFSFQKLVTPVDTQSAEFSLVKAEYMALYSISSAMNSYILGRWQHVTVHGSECHVRQTSLT